MVLHNHPWNARRAATGKSPVNSLWFWGAGKVPDHVATPHALVHSGDAMLQALAAAAGVPWSAGGPRFSIPDMDALSDLRELRDPTQLFDDWLLPAETDRSREIFAPYALWKAVDSPFAACLAR